MKIDEAERHLLESEKLKLSGDRFGAIAMPGGFGLVLIASKNHGDEGAATPHAVDRPWTFSPFARAAPRLDCPYPCLMLAWWGVSCNHTLLYGGTYHQSFDVLPHLGVGKTNQQQTQGA